MHSGPLPADILILTDYPEFGGFNIRAVQTKLEKLGIASASCFVLTLLETPPPKGDDGTPEIKNWISKRKTPPGKDWVKHGDNWLSSEVALGRLKALTQIKEVSPKLIVTLGEAPFTALTGLAGHSTWRGSRLSVSGIACPVLPTYHPRLLVKQPSEAFVLNIDLTRAYNIYTGKQLPRHYQFTIEPTAQQVFTCLTTLLERANLAPLILSSDLETRAGHIACHGIAWSAEHAICIPHLVVSDTNPFYWNVEDEAIIVSLTALGNMPQWR